MPVPKAAQHRSRRLLSDIAYDAIRGLILNGGLKPGETIDDTALQEWLDASRTPIREALNRLQIDGLVETEAQRHTRVVSPDPKDVPDVVRSLGAVMSGATRLTLPVINEDDRRKLVAIARNALAAARARDHKTHLDTVLAFHEIVVDLCPNPFYKELARGVLTRLGFYLRVTNTVNVAQWDQLVRGYGSLVDALDAGDAIRADLAIALVHML